MLEMIKKPPKGWEHVVTKHFTCNKKNIIKQVNEWINEAENDDIDQYKGLVSSHNS